MSKRIEQDILGSILIDNEKRFDVGELEPHHFRSVKNRLIFESIVSMSKEGMAIDLVSMKEHLQGRGLLETISVTYLASLVDGVPTYINVASASGCLIDASGGDSEDEDPRVKEGMRLIREGAAMFCDAVGDKKTVH